MSALDFPALGHGVGLRPKHYSQFLESQPQVSWVEAITENFLGGGRPVSVLEKVRRDRPVVLHGVSLSIGAVDPLNMDYLRRVRDLAARIEPAWVSDHLCWGSHGGRYVHDLLPLPYTDAGVSHVVERVQRVQDFLGRRILLENVSSYVSFRESTMPEWEFLSHIANAADCGILLDVNNIYVSSRNHGFDPREYLEGVPSHRVAQIHLAGYEDKGRYLLDTHDAHVTPPVWELYADAIRLFGPVTTLIEWDDHVPELDELLAESAKAQEVERRVVAEERPLSLDLSKPLPSFAKPDADGRDPMRRTPRHHNMKDVSFRAHAFLRWSPDSVPASGESSSPNPSSNQRKSNEPPIPVFEPARCNELGSGLEDSPDAGTESGDHRRKARARSDTTFMAEASGSLNRSPRRSGSLSPVGESSSHKGFREVQREGLLSVAQPQSLFFTALHDHADPAELERCFLGTDEMPALERVGVYENMYRWRLIDALREDFPKLLALVGDDEFLRIATGYIAAHPSESPDIGEFGRAMATFLSGRERDLAKLEWTRVVVFHEQRAEPIAATVLAAIPQERVPLVKLRFAPALRLLQFEIDPLPMWRAIDDDQPAPNPAKVARAWAAVWRREFEVLHTPLVADEAEALSRALAGQSLAEVCEAFVGREDAAVAAFGAIASWFHEGWISKVEM